MKKLVLISLFACALSSAAVEAKAGGYKAAGCGLGSMVIQDDGMMQILAATTNGTFGNQTFGISSGTSNCAGAGGFVKADAAQEMYVSSNLDSLSQEMAQGSGEHLSALASLFGCDGASKAGFSALVRKNYRSIVGAEATTESMISGVKQAVSADAVLSQSCNQG